MGSLNLLNLVQKWLSCHQSLCRGKWTTILPSCAWSCFDSTRVHREHELTDKSVVNVAEREGKKKLKKENKSTVHITKFREDFQALFLYFQVIFRHRKHCLGASHIFFVTDTTAKEQIRIRSGTINADAINAFLFVSFWINCLQCTYGCFNRTYTVPEMVEKNEKKCNVLCVQIACFHLASFAT